MFAFTIGVRVGRTSLQAAGTLFERGKSVMLASVRAVVFLVIMLFLIKLPLDLLIYGVPGVVGAPTPKAWQFGVFGILLAISLYIGLFRKQPFQMGANLEWPPLASITVLLLYCLGALWVAIARPYGWWLIPLWIVATTIALIHALSPFGIVGWFLARRTAARRRRGIP
jgi:hypothetical protein